MAESLLRQTPNWPWTQSSSTGLTCEQRTSSRYRPSAPGVPTGSTHLPDQHGPTSTCWFALTTTNHTFSRLFPGQVGERKTVDTNHFRRRCTKICRPCRHPHQPSIGKYLRAFNPPNHIWLTIFQAIDLAMSCKSAKMTIPTAALIEISMIVRFRLLTCHEAVT